MHDFVFHPIRVLGEIDVNFGCLQGGNTPPVWQKACTDTLTPNLTRRERADSSWNDWSWAQNLDYKAIMATFAPLLWELVNQQCVLFLEWGQTSEKGFSWSISPCSENILLGRVLSGSRVLMVTGGKFPVLSGCEQKSWRKWRDCCHPVTVHMIDDWDEELTKRSDRKLMETEEHMWGFLKAGFHYVKQNKPGWKCFNLKFQSAVLN